MIEEYGWSIVISVYAVYLLGITALVGLAAWSSVWALNKTLRALRIYREFITFAAYKKRERKYDED